MTRSLDFALALDPGMNARVFEFHTTGTYEVQGPSATVPGAQDMLFREDTKAVTLRATDPKLIEAFGLAQCNLTPGVKTDISATGCAIWKPVADCGEDYDLLALDTDQNLYFGVRPADNDMCTPDKRPIALLPAVVKRN
jgi:predicted small secreted protein